MRSRGFKRALGSIVAASAAVVGLVVMTPATASAAPAILPPPVSASAADNAITFTITNPNPRFSFINCTVAILNARDVPDVIRDPAKLLQPGVLVYPTVSNILDLFAVSPGQTITRTVGNLPAGVYAVAGACVRLLDPTNPTIAIPQAVVVGGWFEGAGTGSLSGSLEDLGYTTVQDLIDAWNRISSGSSGGSFQFEYQGGSDFEVVGPTS